MRRHGKRTASTGRVFQAGRAIWSIGLASAALIVAVAASPNALGAERLAVRLAAAVKSLPRKAPVVPPALLHGRFYNGTPAVGALFTTTGSGQLGQHFCTGSVVASPAGDLVITAAHCMQGKQPGDVDFVPGYHRSQQPFGVWTVSQVFVDRAWASSRNPNDDFAFLVVSQPGDATPIQDLTGGENLGTGWKPVQKVQVVGYPDGQAAADHLHLDHPGVRRASAGVRLRRVHRRDQRRAVPGQRAPGHRPGHGDRRDRRLRAGRGHPVGVLLGPVRQLGPRAVQQGRGQELSSAARRRHDRVQLGQFGLGRDPVRRGHVRLDLIR